MFRKSQSQQKLPLISHPEYYNFNVDQDSIWKTNLYGQALQEHKNENKTDFEYITPEHATKEEVESIHVPEYANKVLGLPEQNEKYLKSQGAWEGGPWDKSAQNTVLRVTGGTIKANKEALNKGMSIQYWDAMHHAYPHCGSGFCPINDVAIAAKQVSNQGKRVLILDTDVHQGQGTAVSLANNPNIYTLSLHEEKNYPSPKEKSSQDVGFDYFITDDEYLQLLKIAVTKAQQEFGNPDLVMYIAGTDLYGGDQLSHTKITIQGIRARDEFVFNYYGSRGIPISTSIPQGYAKNPKDSIQMIKNTLKLAQDSWQKYYNPK